MAWYIWQHMSKAKSKALFLLIATRPLSPYKPSIPFVDIVKQCRPRSDAAELGVWSGSWLFVDRNISSKWKSTPNTPKIENGLVQLKRVDRSTRQIWVQVCVKQTYLSTQMISACLTWILGQKLASQLILLFLPTGISTMGIPLSGTDYGLLPISKISRKLFELGAWNLVSW